MRLHKKDITVFIDLWLQSDPMIWATFSDTQRKILNLRIVKEQSFKDIAKQFKVEELMVRLIFESILMKMDKAFDKQIATTLHYINDSLERPKTKIIEANFNQVFLN